MIKIPENYKPTKSELIDKLNSCTKTEKLIYNCVAIINENLFAFLCGVIINLPITIIFNLIAINVEKCIYNIIYFVLYVFAFIISLVLAIYLIIFSLKHIEIHNNIDSEKNKEIYKNILAEKIFESMNILKKSLYVILSQIILFTLTMVAMFVINNVFNITQEL